MKNKESSVARTIWKDRGELYSCPNPTHDFTLGRLMGQWTMANKCWTEISANGYLHNNYFRFCTIKTLDGLKSYNLILWKLNIMIAFIKKNP